MVVEAAVALGAGVAARSVLLTAFGVDSVIELLSGIVLYRRLAAESTGMPTGEVSRLEARAVRIPAVLLVLLCAYVVLSSIAGVAFRLTPSPSLAGLVLSASTIVAMPLFARAQRSVNGVIQHPLLRADRA